MGCNWTRNPGRPQGRRFDSATLLQNLTRLPCKANRCFGPILSSLAPTKLFLRELSPNLTVQTAGIIFLPFDQSVMLAAGLGIRGWCLAQAAPPR